jgi:hypothetical protein
MKPSFVHQGHCSRLMRTCINMLSHCCPRHSCTVVLIQIEVSLRMQVHKAADLRGYSKPP